MLFDLHQPHKPRIDSLSSNLKLFKSSSRAVHWAWHPHKHQKSNQVHQCNQKILCCQKHCPAFGKLCAEHTVFTVWVAGIAGAKMHICPCSGFLHVTCEFSTKEVETYGTSCVLTSLDPVFLRMQWCRFLVVAIQKPLPHACWTGIKQILPVQLYVLRHWERSRSLYPEIPPGDIPWAVLVTYIWGLLTKRLLDAINNQLICLKCASKHATTFPWLNALG